MKVGMIFECGSAGADKAVCELLAQRLKPGIQIASITLDNKPKLLADCGEAAAQLFKDGCQRVVIVWDLYPPWREAGANSNTVHLTNHVVSCREPCSQEDRRWHEPWLSCPVGHA